MKTVNMILILPLVVLALLPVIISVIIGGSAIITILSLLTFPALLIIRGCLKLLTVLWKPLLVGLLICPIIALYVLGTDFLITVIILLALPVLLIMD